jgi:hypothetical protein
MPFTTEQFLGKFESYNISVFPAQPVLYVLSCIAVALTFGRARSSGLIVTLALASLGLGGSGLSRRLFCFDQSRRACVRVSVYRTSPHGFLPRRGQGADGLQVYP